MRNSLLLLFSVLAAGLVSCAEKGGTDIPDGGKAVPELEITPSGVASVLASLPIARENLQEVYDAVSSSSGNGFDEEYLMSDLFLRPGSGVGGATKAPDTYERPLRALFEDYLRDMASTKAGDSGFNPEEYMERLASSGLQVYFPYHDEVDAGQYPVITFDPGYGAETNYGYEISSGADGSRKVSIVQVNEVVARQRPVWVINTNDDSAYTPLELYLSEKAGNGMEVRSASKRKLLLKTFRMIRNYDSWFAGASEFKLQIGSVDGFKATTDAELALYRPAVTELVIVVKRKDVDTDIPFDGLLMTDFTSQQDKVAFLLTEDDGGTTTSWKCSASVKYQSKSYGFDLDIPYRDKDDIVWRGQLDADFFREEDVVTSRFGDTRLSFALE